MSSSDRNPRRQSNPRQSSPPDRADEVIFEDDVYYGGDWREEDIYEDEVVDYTAPQTNQRSTRSSQGTAAQLDQLQQNMGRRNSAGDTGKVPSQAPRQQPTSRYDDEVGSTPTTRSRSATQETSQTRLPTPQIDYVEYDTDIDEFDPYDEYDDDFTEYDAPRRAPRAQRQVSMPNLKRPSLPPAIANAELVNDVPALAMIGGGLVSLLAMSILVGNQASTLAPEFATHVSASGVLEDFSSESAIWNLPLMAGAFTLMNLAIAWFTAPIDRFASRFVLAAALLVQLLIWVAVIRIL